MNCSNCGKQVKDGVSFCPHCGKALKSISQDKKGYTATQPKKWKIPLIIGGISLVAVVAIACFAFGKKEGDWKQQYQDYFKNYPDLMDWKYDIVDINSDGIPEIAARTVEFVNGYFSLTCIFMINDDGEVVKINLGDYLSYNVDYGVLCSRTEDTDAETGLVHIKEYYLLDTANGILEPQHKMGYDRNMIWYLDDSEGVESMSEFSEIFSKVYDTKFSDLSGALDGDELLKAIKKYEVKVKTNKPQKEDETKPSKVQATGNTTVAVAGECVQQVGSEVTLTEEQKNGILDFIKTLAWMKYGDESARLTKDGDFIASFVLYSANKSDSIIDNYDGAKEGFHYGNRGYIMSITEDSLKKYLEDSIGVNDITVLKEWVKQNEVDFSRTHLLNCKDGVFLLNPPDTGDFDVSEPVISKVTTVSRNEILIEGSVEEIIFMDESVLSKKQFQITMTVNPDSVWGGYTLDEIREWKTERAGEAAERDDNLPDWQKAYDERYQSEKSQADNPSFIKTTLIYLDDDNVPECILWLTPYSDSAYREVCVLSYKNGKLLEFTSEEAGYDTIFSYTERSGTFSIKEILGLRSATWWEIVQLDEDFNKIGSAWTDNDWDNYYYQINDKDVESQEMSDYFDSYGFKTVLTTSDLYSSMSGAYDALISGKIGSDNTKVGDQNSSDYVLSDSDSRYLSEQELSVLGKEQLRLARNEIYARHGLIFTKDDTKQYFEAKSWYKGTVTEVTDDMFNEYEIANRDLIISMESN